MKIGNPRGVEIVNKRKAKLSSGNANCVTVGEVTEKRKAKRSQGTSNCVTVGRVQRNNGLEDHMSDPRKVTRRPSLCYNEANCVNVGVASAIDDHTRMIAVTDSKLGDESPVTMYTPSEWRTLLSDVKAGTVDRDDIPQLSFTEGEWEAFLDGVTKGEFDLDENDLLPPVPVEQR